MAIHNSIGKWGEDIACEKLIKEGYAIMERNWRLGHYEVDIIASKGDRIIFVEVKTRSNPDADPVEAVDRRKRMHMVSSANAYINHTQTRLEPQFDIIGITATPTECIIEHIEDAFVPPLKTYR